MSSSVALPVRSICALDCRDRLPWEEPAAARAALNWFVLRWPFRGFFSEQGFATNYDSGCFSGRRLFSAFSLNQSSGGWVTNYDSGCFNCRRLFNAFNLNQSLGGWVSIFRITL